MLKSIIVLAMCLLISACSANNQPIKPSEISQIAEDPTMLSNPNHPVIVLFEGIKEADFESIKMVSPLLEEKLAEVSEYNVDLEHPFVSAAIKTVFKGMKYKVNSTTVSEDGNTATVNVEVTYPDISNHINTVVEENSQLILKTLLSQNTSNMEETAKTIITSIAKSVVSNPTIDTATDIIDVSCYKEQDKWQINYTEKLVNICFANSVDTVQNLIKPSK